MSDVNRFRGVLYQTEIGWTMSKPCLECRWVEDSRLCDPGLRFVCYTRCKRHAAPIDRRAQWPSVPYPTGTQVMSRGGFIPSAHRWERYQNRVVDNLPGEPVGVYKDGRPYIQAIAPTHDGAGDPIYRRRRHTSARVRSMIYSAMMILGVFSITGIFGVLVVTQVVLLLALTVALCNAQEVRQDEDSVPRP